MSSLGAFASFRTCPRICPVYAKHQTLPGPVGNFAFVPNADIRHVVTVSPYCKSPVLSFVLSRTPSPNKTENMRAHGEGHSSPTVGDGYQPDARVRRQADGGIPLRRRNARTKLVLSSVA